MERKRSLLAISVGRISLCSPLLIAAGPWSAGDELAPDLTAEAPAVGAVVCKTVTLHSREGNPEPTVRVAAGGLLNRIGLRNPGASELLATRLPRLLALQVPIVVSVAAPESDELGRLIAQLEDQTDPDQVVGYELNASCPNISGEPPAPAQLQELVATVRQQTTRPLWVKLGFADRTLLTQRARACAAGGADAIVAINTVPALAVSGCRVPTWPAVERELIPFLGGLSGACLHPLALRAVWELTHAQPLPVIGCGGVSSLAEALAFFAVGAQAVQIGSALHPLAHSAQRPVLPTLYADLLHYLGERGVPSLLTLLQELA